MAIFIELTISKYQKCLINIETINEVWSNPKSGTYVSTNQNEGSTYQESYEEVKELIRKSQSFLGK